MIGEWIGAGARGPSDLKRACERIAAGDSIGEIAKDIPSAFVRNYKGLALLRSHVAPERPEWIGQPRVIWLWGQTGKDKSRTALTWPGSLYELALRAGKGTCWFDGYVCQETIVIDELRWEEVRYSDFLRWTRGYTFQAPVKTASVWVRANTWIVTSNDHYNRVWPGEDFGPLERRLTDVIQFHKDKAPTVERGSWPLEPEPCHGHAVEPGNTLPVQPPATRAVTPSNSGGSQSSIAMLVQAAEQDLWDFCDKHGLPDCSACDPKWT